MIPTHQYIREWERERERDKHMPTSIINKHCTDFSGIYFLGIFAPDQWIRWMIVNFDFFPAADFLHFQKLKQHLFTIKYTVASQKSMSDHFNSLDCSS